MRQRPSEASPCARLDLASRADRFVATLPPIERFEHLADPASYRPLPAGWHLALGDIAGSGAAIAAGEYKAVNTTGVAIIAALANALKPAVLPYLFGGDGALVCVPPGGAAAARPALAATAAMAAAQFGLTLRTALVPVEHVRAHGHDVRVACHRVSPHYAQCAFDGGGTLFAEAQLKEGALPAAYRVAPDAGAPADYGGLECRWHEIPSPHEETVAVIVSGPARAALSLDACRRAMAAIGEIYGSAEQCHPVRARSMRVALSARVLRYEARLKGWRQQAGTRARHRLQLGLQSMLGWLLFATRARLGGTDWGRYREDAAANTDFRKLDGCLRLVLAGTAQQRAALERALEAMRRAGEIGFGIHAARSAIMTCLIEQRQHAHVHFVDAAGGGYAEAARRMKA